MAPETLAKNFQDNGGKNLTRIMTSDEINEANRGQTGGKAYALARLVRAGFRVPEFLCVTAEVYREFLQKTGLGPRIFFELQRKPFMKMRWEEIWDAALRIRLLRIRTYVRGGHPRKMKIPPRTPFSKGGAKGLFPQDPSLYKRNVVETDVATGIGVIHVIDAILMIIY